ncbi:hypothetical protein ACT453_40115 [Bacillus sp. D-CC]
MRARGAKIITITSYQKSALSQLASVRNSVSRVEV